MVTISTKNALEIFSIFNNSAKRNVSSVDTAIEYAKYDSANYSDIDKFFSVVKFVTNTLDSAASYLKEIPGGVSLSCEVVKLALDLGRLYNEALYSDKAVAASTVTSVIGDLLSVSGKIAELAPSPQTKIVGVILDLAGSGVAYLSTGLAAREYSETGTISTESRNNIQKSFVNEWYGGQFDNALLLDPTGNDYMLFANGVPLKLSTDPTVASDDFISVITNDVVDAIEAGYYVVKSGNILGDIAIKFGISDDLLAQINNIPDKNTIYPGQKIYLPYQETVNADGSWNRTEYGDNCFRIKTTEVAADGSYIDSFFDNGVLIRQEGIDTNNIEFEKQYTDGALSSTTQTIGDNSITTTVDSNGNFSTTGDIAALATSGYKVYYNSAEELPTLKSINTQPIVIIPINQDLPFSSDPIGAFYEVTTPANDNAPSIATLTGQITLNGSAISAVQLANLDSNHDGKISAADNAFNQLNIWQDSNEDGKKDAGEVIALTQGGITGIRNEDYAQYTSGNTTDKFDLNNVAPNSSVQPVRDPSQFHIISRLYGGNNNDLIFGYDGNDYIDSGNGNDQIQGGDGNDQLLGEDGDDLIFGQTGDDTAFGGNGNDQIQGGAGSDRLLGEDGDDLIFGQDGDDTAFGGNGNDQMVGGVGSDQLLGEDGDDLIFGQDGDDTAFGGNNNDQIQGGYGNDYLYGEAGDDLIFGQTGNDVICGGDGNDVLVGFTGYNDPKQTLNAGETDNDYLDGGNGNDLIFADIGDDTVFGGNGNDEIQGGDGNDYLYGEEGSDKIFGQTGNDVIYGGDGDDLLIGFTGYNESKQTLNAGETDNDKLFGGAGNDKLWGGLGDDYLDGGAGADYMEGGAGNDIYIVNSVNDVILEHKNEGHDTVFSSSNYLLNAEIEELKLLGTADINGTGNSRDNLIIGNSGDNILDGVTGADTMIGQQGNDEYYVDNANDIVTELAGEGVDTVQSSISTTLSDNVENLMLLSYQTPEQGMVDGEKVYVYGYPKRYELDYMQGDAVPDYYGTCALTSISNLLTQANVDNIGEETVVRYAIDSGNAITTTVTSNPYELGGSNYIQQMEILNHFGMKSGLISGYSPEFIADRIREGRGVLIGVNAGKLWGEAAYIANNQVNHLITVSGVVYNEANTEIKGFYVCDSGRRQVSDMVRYLSVADFNNAANVNSAYTIYSQNTIKLWDTNINGTGNELNNIIIGTEGNNILDGGSGYDTLYGGIGDDTYVVDNSGDVVVEDANEGSDEVYSEISYTLGANVENLKLTGTTAINATGNEFDNNLYGNSGENVFDGKNGNDVLYGGGGNDTYVFGRGYGQDLAFDYDTTVGNLDTVRMTADVLPGDVIVSRDSDNLYLYISGTTDKLTLSNWFVEDSSRIEQVAFADGTVWDEAMLIEMTLSITTEGDDILYGFAGSDTLYGQDGNDMLDGGAGADTLIGGVGDDTYYVDNSGDVVVENSTEGSDSINAGISYTLGANVENLSLTGTTAINATGNELDNDLYGNFADNILDGKGGNDNLSGSKGNDTYVFGRGYGQDYVSDFDSTVGNIDAVQMTADVRPDDVIVSRSFDHLYVEIVGTMDKLRLSNWFAGDANKVEQIKFTDGTVWDLSVLVVGSEYNDVLYGSAGNNTLLGRGGNDRLDGETGSDTMIGGTGNDIYFVDNNGDVVVENADEGSDTVNSKVNYTLGANVENLTLAYSSSATYGTGNDLDNNIYDNFGNNTLDGKAGNDNLYGSNGNDTYIFGRGYGQDNVWETGSAEDNDTVRMTDDVLPGEVTVSRDSSNLFLDIVGTADRLTLVNWFTDGYRVDQVIFADGTVWDSVSLLEKVQIGTETVANTMIGGAGDDIYLVDNSGDVIVENAGEGFDTVQSSVTHTLDANVENLWLTGTTAINATGNELDNNLIGNNYDNVLEGKAGNDNLYGSNGNDTLDGGAGNDTLNGGAGNDIYVFGRGYGQDLVSEYSTTSDNIDTVQMDADVMPGEVIVSRDLYDLYLSISGTTDKLRLSNWFREDASRIEQVRFADGTMWDVAALIDMTLIGSESNDYMYGSSGNDTLLGQGGNDWLHGGAGADILIAGTGNDIYFVDNSGDVVVENANEGMDGVYSEINYTLGANIESLHLMGTTAINATGNELDNSLYGNAGNNILDGKAGNDMLFGGSGNDTYLFGHGYGQDCILEDIGNLDMITISMAADVMPTDVIVSNFGGLILKIVGTADKLTLSGLSTNDTDKNVQVMFADGTAWDMALLIAKMQSSLTLIGTESDDYLYGFVGDDILDGGAGNDGLMGGAGNDTYVFGRGYGQDFVSDYDEVAMYGGSSMYGNFDTVQMAADVTASDVTVSGIYDMMSGGCTGLSLKIEGTTDELSLLDWFTEACKIEQVSFADGTVWDIGTLLSKTLSGTEGDDNLYGYAGDDILDGGAGNDWLMGDAGNDTYIFGRGYGQDTVNDCDIAAMYGGYSTNDNFDTVQMAANVLSGDVIVSGIYDVWSGSYSGLSLKISGTTDELSLLNWYEDAYKIEQVTFVDGTVWDAAALIARAGTADNNALSGDAGDDILDGMQGNDTLDGKQGSDVLIGGTGSDTYVFGRGYGSDTIQENDTTIAITDTAVFDAGIATDQLWFRQVGNNLEASIIGTTDMLTIENWYSGSAYHVEQFRTADNKVLLDTQVDALVNAMAAFTPPSAGQTSMPQNYQDTLAPVLAANWH